MGLSVRKLAELNAVRTAYWRFPVTRVLQSKRQRATRLIASLTRSYCERVLDPKFTEEAVEACMH